MNDERMRLQRDVLLDVIKHGKAFDMSSWVSLMDDFEEHLTESGPLAKGMARLGPNNALVEIGCGTASCAYGWLCRDPRGKALGLGINMDGDPTYGGLIDNGESFFQLTPATARWLFMPDSYFPVDPIGPAHVIRRIDWLLEGNDPDDFPAGDGWNTTGWDIPNLPRVGFVD